MSFGNVLEYATRTLESPNTPDLSKTFNPDLTTQLLYFFLCAGAIYVGFRFVPYANDSLQNLRNKYQERRERRFAENFANL
jgi:hypothetical protein